MECYNANIIVCAPYWLLPKVVRVEHVAVGLFRPIRMEPEVQKPKIVVRVHLSIDPRHFTITL